MAWTFSQIAVCPMASPLGLWKNVVIPHVLYHTTNSHQRRLAIGVVIHASLTLPFVRCLLCVMVLCIIRSSVERERPKSQVAGCNSKRAKRLSQLEPYQCLAEEGFLQLLLDWFWETGTKRRSVTAHSYLLVQIPRYSDTFILTFVHSKNLPQIK